MQLDKPVQLRLSNQSHDELRELAWDSGMKFSSYCRYVLVNHIKENENEK